jgi:hypothetical protein
MLTTLDGKSERKGPLGRLRRKWGDNIKMELKEDMKFWQVSL